MIMSKNAIKYAVKFILSIVENAFSCKSTDSKIRKENLVPVIPVLKMQ